MRNNKFVLGEQKIRGAGGGGGGGTGGATSLR